MHPTRLSLFPLTRGPACTVIENKTRAAYLSDCCFIFGVDVVVIVLAGVCRVISVIGVWVFELVAVVAAAVAVQAFDISVILVVDVVGVVLWQLVSARRTFCR